MRIEGQTQTLLASTTVTLPDTKAPGNPCSGQGAERTVGAAIEEATKGNWDHQSFTQTILGETHDFSADDYWAEWRNETFGHGICSDADQLQSGDRVLMLVDFSPPPSYAPTVFPLVLAAPRTIAPSTPFQVSATEYRTDGTPGTSSPTPASGVTVTGGTASAITGSDGQATVTIEQRGVASLRASRSNGERSEYVSVCVTDGADGFCGTTKPGEPAPPAGSSGPAPTPTAPDTTAAFAKIASITEGKHYARGRGPRTLAGRVDPDASGLKDVRIRLSRTSGPSCTYYDGTRERFVAARRCGVKHARTFSVGSTQDFSYLLPSALAPGRYVMDVIVIDRSGNQTMTYQRGRNRVVFFVG